MKGCVAREVGGASSLPVPGASCPKFLEGRGDRTPTRGWKPLEPAGGDACPTASGVRGEAFHAAGFGVRSRHAKAGGRYSTRGGTGADRIAARGCTRSENGHVAQRQPHGAPAGPHGVARTPSGGFARTTAAPAGGPLARRRAGGQGLPACSKSSSRRE